MVNDWIISIGFLFVFNKHKSCHNRWKDLWFIENIGNGIIKSGVVMIELTKRQRDILCTLIKTDDYMTLDTLAENFNVSKRTIKMI